jgi:alkylation response protein AidB-like acyl-CoA dehydrogenase
MIDYHAPVESLLFALRHGAEASRLPHWDDELAAQVLAEAGRFIEAEIAPLDPIGDHQHAHLVEGRVRLPEAFVVAYRGYCEAGWPGLAGDEAYGGQGLPHVLASSVSEMLSGSCVSFQMVLSLAQGAMRAIAAQGTPAQRDHYLPRLVSGEWLATMCLTEPQAGSDLSQTRTVAEPIGNGRHRITGAKIFISGGDQNFTDNIVHLVLARTPGAPPGVKGLSLFLCPAVLEDGRRNAVACVRIEEKMGLHASPTCQMAFDNTEGELLGAEGSGLANMFVMMNAERLDVGLQGVGLSEVAGQRSRAYAAERRQGRGADGSTTLINRHADVQRMLMTQIALTEGCRALCYRTEVELELGANTALVDFLTPVCKAFCTEAALESASHAIQIHGGYGYLTEYRVEQILRDARITPIYEGTNGIQAITLADRVLRAKGGAAGAAFRNEIESAIALAAPVTATALRDAFGHWQRATAALLDQPASGFAATSYLRLCGLLAVGALWARMELAAEHSPKPQRTRTAAAFYRDWMLPECHYLVLQVGRGLSLTAPPVEVFDVD